MEGILDRRKGDLLVLHGLCLLIEQHARFYLKDGKVCPVSVTHRKHKQKQWTKVIFISPTWGEVSTQPLLRDLRSQQEQQ